MYLDKEKPISTASVGRKKKIRIDEENKLMKQVNKNIRIVIWAINNHLQHHKYITKKEGSIKPLFI